ncbi:MAG: hypothetical protein HW376_1364, partial [candidate division NC10 bacterium]|nr:hypothetical protein [candidate division NC10 bacterium]
RLGHLSAVATWRYVLSYGAVLEKATPEAVKDLAREILERDRAVIGRSIPKEERKGSGGGEGLSPPPLSPAPPNHPPS